MSGKRQCGIRIDFIQPGNLQENAHAQSYNRTVRYDWLAHHLFDSIAETVKASPAEYTS